MEKEYEVRDYIGKDYTIQKRNYIMERLQIYKKKLYRKELYREELYKKSYMVRNYN